MSRHSLAPRTSARPQVLPFRPPDHELLATVEADCHRLFIPTYADIKGPYREALDRFWRQQDKTESRLYMDRTWEALATRTGVSPEALKVFRDTNADYTKWLYAREQIFEAGAYLLGLYVARREFPRLGGWVL